MRKMMFSIIATCMVGFLYADNVIVFDYDDSGNRVSRSFRISDEDGINMQIRKNDDPSDELPLFEMEIKATPNPTPGLVHVEINCDDSDVESVSVFTVKGQEIDHKLSAIADFDLSGQPVGIYVLVAKTKFGNVSYKIVKK